jgi:hypothetical protein
MNVLFVFVLPWWIRFLPDQLMSLIQRNIIDGKQYTVSSVGGSDFSQHSSAFSYRAEIMRRTVNGVFLCPSVIRTQLSSVINC